MAVTPPPLQDVPDREAALQLWDLHHLRPPVLRAGGDPGPSRGGPRLRPSPEGRRGAAHEGGARYIYL